MTGHERPWLLAVDIGNSQIVLGVFEEDRLHRLARLTAQAARTADDLVSLLGPLLDPFRPQLGSSRRAVVASVVPSLTPAYEEYLREHLGIVPVLVGPRLPIGLRIDVPDPASVGADRIANAVAASALYPLPAVVVDLGSATNFDVVLRGPRYVGGVIAPGVLTSAEELFRRAARLAKVELRVPRRAIGKTTEECVQSGVLFGAAGQIDGIVDRIRKEIGRSRPTIVATGGLASSLAPLTRNLRRVEPALTIHGLRIVDERVRAARARRESA